MHVIDGMSFLSFEVKVCSYSYTRFNFPEGTVELYAEKVQTRGLCAIAQVNHILVWSKTFFSPRFHQAESLRYKLIGGLAVRRACYGVLRFIMERGAMGCEVMFLHLTLHSNIKY